MFKKIVLGILIFFLIALLLVVVLYWRTNLIAELVQSIINDNLRSVATVHYSSLKGNIFQTITVDHLTLTMKNGTLMSCNSLKIRYSLFSALSRKYFFRSILLDSLYIRLNPSGEKAGTDTSRTIKSYDDLMAEFASSSDFDSLFLSLPTIQIGSLKILHGKFERPYQPLTLDSVGVELSASLNRDIFEFRIVQFSGKWLERNFRWSNLSCELSAHHDRITMNKLQLITPYSHAYGSMDITVNDTLAVILGLEEVFVDYRDINSLFPEQKLDSGFIELSCQIIGSPQHFTGKLSAVGKANNYFMDSFLLSGSYQQGEINISKSKLVVNRSMLEFDVALLKTGSHINLHFDHFDVKNFLPNYFHTDLSGTLRMQMPKLNFKIISGYTELFLYNSIIDSISFDSLHLALRAQDNDFTFLDNSFLKVGPGSRFSVSGTINRDRILDLSLRSENNSIASLTRALRVANFSGQFDVNIYIRGELMDPNLEGYLWIPKLVYRNWQLDTLLLETNINHLVRQRLGQAKITANRIRSGYLELTETRADLIFKGRQIVLDTLLFAKGENRLSAAGIFSFVSDTLQVQFDFFRLFYENYWIENSGPLLFSYDKSDFNIERAIFSAPENGTIEIRGFYEQASSDMQIGVYLENIQVNPFRQFFKTDIAFSGALAGDFQVIQPLTNPRLDVSLQGKDLKINRLPLGDVSGTFRYENDKFSVSQFKMVYNGSEIDMQGDIAIRVTPGDSSAATGLLGGSQANLAIQWQNISLEPYNRFFKLPRPLKGYLSGNWKIGGSLKNPSGDLSMTAYGISYDKFNCDSLVLQADFTPGLVVLNRLQFDLNGTSIEGTGWQQIDLDFTAPDTMIGQRPFFLNLQSHDDRLEFIGLFNEQIEGLRGAYESEFTITGTPSKPVIASGFFRMKNGQLDLSRVKNPITRVAIDATVENSQMTIKSFSGYSEKHKDLLEKISDYFRRGLKLIGIKYQPAGIIAGKGTILFDNLTHPKLDLQVKFSRFFIDYFIENTNLVFSSNNFHLTGRDTMNVTGDVLIEEGNYLVDMEKLQKNIYLETKSSKPERTLSWNLDITIPGNFKIRNSKLSLVNDFELEISGELRSIQEPLAPSMELSGHMETLSGKYTAWGQNFVIRNGTINFTNPKVINPDFDIRAEKLNRGYTYELSITGNLQKQNLDLQVKDEQGTYLDYTMADKIALLSLGSTTRELSAGDMASVGKDVFSTSVESALGRGAELVTGLDKVEVSLTGNISDPQAFKLNQGLKNASFAVGKYFTSNLYLEYQSEFGQGLIPTPKLSWEPGNRIGLTYRIANKWSIDSYYAQTLRGNDQIKIALSWKTTF
jgi:autotransporter translocation and assembly factor TamB